jgi:hydroxyacylglutathione hydrolase
MKIHQIFFKNTLRNFCYLIDFGNGDIYCIDPFRSNEVIEELKGQNLKGIINTHDHCDHFSGNAELVDQYRCSVMAHHEAQVPLKTMSLSDKEIIFQNENWTLLALWAPGHTMSHLCLMLEKDGEPYALFTGDCFFNAGVGNCHNGGNAEVLFRTICTLFRSFPDQILIYPGHEYLKRNLEFTKNYEPQNIAAQEFLHKCEKVNLDEVFFVNTMKVERTINTFLRLDSENLRSTLNLEKATDKDIFLALRELRNRW